MTAAPEKTLLPSLAVIVSAVFWGSMWMPLHALGDAGLSGSWSAWSIYGVPAVILLPFVLRNGIGGLMAGGWPLVWLGVSIGACNYLYAASVVYGDVARIVLLFYVNPVWSVLLERLILGTPLTRGRVGALALGIAGMWILNYDGQGLPLPRSVAEWAGLVAGFCWAAGLVAMRVTPQISMVDKAFAQYVAAFAVGGLVLSTGIFPGQADWSPVQWGPVVLWIAAITVIWVLPSLLLSFYGAARLSPTRASMLFMVEVVVGVVTAAIWTDYPFGWREGIGGLVILSAGVVEVLFGAAHPKAKEAPAS
jgi:drug/metabolite transporter (DMT)-like permease